MATSRNRDYSSPPEGIKNVAALYAWDQTNIITGTTNPQTGAWSSLQINPDGSLRVALTSDINIDSLNLSGINVNTDQLEVINTSGTQFLASISGFTRFLSTGTSSVRFPAANTVSNLIPSGGHFTGASIITGIALQANLNRRAFFIQNNSSRSPLYVEFGAPPTSTGNYSMILNPSIANGMGGDSFYDAPAMYLGQISVSGDGQFIVWEI